MINEFYAALLNTVAINDQPGFDYVPSEWRPRVSSTAANAVRQALLVRPTVASATNWRSAEIRRIITGSDLSSLMVRFDRRDGYALGDIQQDMASRLAPLVSADTDGDRVRFSRRLEADAYVTYRWHIRVGSESYTLTSDRNTVEGVVGNIDTSLTLPGTSIVCTFPSTPNNIMISWASKPLQTIPETATQLRVNLRTSVSELAEEPSVFFDTERSMLRDIVLYNGESPAQVGAATLLLAGATLASTPLETSSYVNSSHESIG